MVKNIETLENDDYSRIPSEIQKNYYGDLVEKLIRKKYSLSAELAILRQKDTKPFEYEEYNQYAEDCKLQARKILYNK
jgi:hypothetical protein